MKVNEERESLLLWIDTCRAQLPSLRGRICLSKRVAPGLLLATRTGVEMGRSLDGAKASSIEIISLHLDDDSAYPSETKHESLVVQESLYRIAHAAQFCIFVPIALSKETLASLESELLGHIPVLPARGPVSAQRDEIALFMEASAGAAALLPRSAEMTDHPLGIVYEGRGCYFIGATGEEILEVLKRCVA